VAHETCETQTSRVSGVMARSSAASTSAGSPPRPISAIATSMPWRLRKAQSGASAPLCSSEVVTTLSPACQSIAHVATFMPSVVAWVSAIRRGSVPSTAATAARASFIRSSESFQYATSARPVRSSIPSSSAIARAVSRGSGPQVPVLK